LASIFGLDLFVAYFAKLSGQYSVGWWHPFLVLISLWLILQSCLDNTASDGGVVSELRIG
jgi:hypothetical protein